MRLATCLGSTLSAQSASACGGTVVTGALSCVRHITGLINRILALLLHVLSPYIYAGSLTGKAVGPVQG